MTKRGGYLVRALALVLLACSSGEARADSAGPQQPLRDRAGKPVATLRLTFPKSIGEPGDVSGELQSQVPTKKTWYFHHGRSEDIKTHNDQDFGANDVYCELAATAFPGPPSEPLGSFTFDAPMVEDFLGNSRVILGFDFEKTHVALECYRQARASLGDWVIINAKPVTLDNIRDALQGYVDVESQ